MADPIVCDCGGSTRIRRVLQAGEGDMPGLLKIQDLVVAGVPSRGSQVTEPFGNNLAFTKMTIMFQDASGVPFTIPVRVLPYSFVIESHLDQKVRGDFSPDFKSLTITVFSTVVDPQVEAKQLRLDLPSANRLRRRYIVSNAGPIKIISVDTGGGLGSVYDSTNTAAAPVTNPAAVGPAAPAPGLPLYVSVVVS